MVGRNGLVAELVTRGGVELRQHLARLFDAILRGGGVPEDWFDVAFALIPKGAGLKGPRKLAPDSNVEHPLVMSRMLFEKVTPAT